MGGGDGDDWVSHRDHGRSYDVNGKIMLSAIISLSFVVLLVTLLHIYARCVLRRQARRQAALRRLGFILPSSAAAAADRPKTGLDPSVIAALPVFVFKQAAAGVECSVCLSSIDDGEIARTLPNCKHTFHVDCVDRWLATNSTCPICRTAAEPRLVAESREAMVVSTAAPSAPPSEGPSDGSSAAKITGPSLGPGSRLSSFRRMLSGDQRSSRRVQSCGHDELPSADIERL
ncbi:E3 ubiquitin-protein ligase ATL41-like [Andrographis paniculata]|uniref:E3 ubiquitin-protein ligase ATL41-like n=1 Tax=Andrographis paniculata TaxID=175694 RepID=UPI0021E7E703|nr:E3 ubiquitin-protein ligase ATL41-like [Andrographis paniculata]